MQERHFCVDVLVVCVEFTTICRNDIFELQCVPMKILLKELATVQVGYSFRSRLEVSEGGDVAVIQMKDLRDDNVVDCSDLAKIDMSGMKEHHFVRKGDLVFRSRGLVTTSALLLEDVGRAVVAAPLLRIRVNDPDKVLSEYLSWYLNQREAQVFLDSRAKGTFQKMIGKEAIDDLEVYLPSLERQKHIVELAGLSAREKQMLHELAEKREQYILAVLMRHVTAAGRGE